MAAPPPPPGFGPPAGQPPGYGQPPGAPPLPPGYAPPAPPSRGGGGMYQIAAGLVGTAVVIYGLVQLFGGGEDPPRTPPPPPPPIQTAQSPAAAPGGSRPQPPPAPPPPPPAGNGQTTVPTTQQPPTATNVEALVQDQVGPFSIVEALDATPFVSDGASTALNLVYADASGNRVQHVLTAWASAAAANQYLDASGSSLQQDGWTLVSEGPVVDSSSGDQIGTVRRYDNGNIAFELFTNANFHFSVAAPSAELVQAFVTNLPY